MCRAESLTQRVKDAEEDEKAALERARREGRVRGMGIVKREGQVERTREHRVVGGIDGEGLEVDGLKGVGVLGV